MNMGAVRHSAHDIVTKEPFWKEMLAMFANCPVLLTRNGLPRVKPLICFRTNYDKVVLLG